MVKRGTVKIELIDPDHEPKMLFAGELDRRGSVAADFRFPEGLMGSFPVRYSADTPLGHVETTETVLLEDKVSVLLTSEKPIYQPSQTIHLRALALDRADRHVAAGRALTFEVEDPRGNKVFRKSTATDNFGVASAEFTLADEVNLGTYHVRAKIGEASAAELAVNVERYVLPKFRVAIEFDSKNGKPKRDYRPGDHVTGAVKANYFFGKPVDNASVTMKASGMDAAAFRSGIGKRAHGSRRCLSLRSGVAAISCRQRQAPWRGAGRGGSHSEGCGRALGDARRADHRKPNIAADYRLFLKVASWCGAWRMKCSFWHRIPTERRPKRTC